MEFNCNSAGVIGTKIIDSPRERLIAIITTNNFVLCNGRFSFLLTIASIFIAGGKILVRSIFDSTLFVLR